MKNIIQTFKDWRWERLHTKVHKKLTFFFKLSEQERNYLRDKWQPKRNQLAVYINEDYTKRHWEHHLPTFNWSEESKKEMVWFDNDKRYIKDDYFPDILFDCTFKIIKVDNDKLYWYKDYFYNKEFCYPILNKKQIEKLKNKKI